MSAPLSVRCKADREKMARLLREALRGAAVTVKEEMRGSREIVLRLYTPCGASCFVDFDGDFRGDPNTWVVTWNTRERMSPFFGMVNSHHGCKATRIFDDFNSLLTGLRRDVEHFADGTAYFKL